MGEIRTKYSFCLKQSTLCLINLQNGEVFLNFRQLGIAILVRLQAQFLYCSSGAVAASHLTSFPFSPRAAATGIPRAQNDHAVRMVKFARDCQESLPNLLTELSNRLGKGTKELAIRVGCHSGPVTAGVLRGDKIRFELFGDTVNTVSEWLCCLRVFPSPPSL